MKNKNLGLIALISSSLIAGCSVGVKTSTLPPPTPSISATIINESAQPCTNMSSTNNLCTIQLTYDNNGVMGLDLTSNPFALPIQYLGDNDTFDSSMQDCHSKIFFSNPASGSCLITITYDQNFATESTTEPLTFTISNGLGSSATSSPAIVISGLKQ